jgi:two-component system cell cycle sensor histidine kinase/response regulator CckA
MSIRAQLFLIVCIVALPAAGVIIHSGITVRNEEVKNALKDTWKLADGISSEQQSMLASTHQLVTALAQLPEVRNHDVARMQSILGNIHKIHSQYSNIFIADRSGTVWVTAIPTPPPFIISDRRYFRNAIASGQLSSGEYVVSRATSKATFNFAYPIKNDAGEVIGAICIGFTLDHFRHLLERSKLPDGASYVLLDHKGVVLSRGINPEPYIGKPYNPEYFKQMEQGPETGNLVGVGIAGDKRIITYRKLTLDGEKIPYLYIRVGIPVETVMERANKALLHDLSLFAPFLLFASILAWFTAKRSIVDRISALQTASRRLAGGDLQVRVLDFVKGGEFGSLGQSFDEMAQQLAKREQERLAAELALRSNESFLRTIIDSEPECVKILGSGGELLLMNPAGLAMIGADSFEQVKGHCIYPLVVPEHCDAFRRVTEDVFQGKEGNLEFEIVGLKGRHVWLDTHAVPLCDENGAITSLLGITRDITKHKEAETEKRNLQDQLNHSQRIESIGRLAGGIAHDFNNLLTPIIGYSELLRLNMKPGDRGMEKVDNIMQAADKARILTQQLLSFGRKQILEMKTIDLNNVVTSFYEILRRTIRESIDIRLHLTPETHGIRADRNQLEQIIMNLAINAQDAIEDKGAITIETAQVVLDEEYARQHAEVKPGRHMMLVVTDTGSGMDKETLSQLFEPFYTTKEMGKGSGLGLATVYGLIKQHDGNIWVYSEPGKGSVFKIYFPIVDNLPVAEQETVSENVLLNAAGRTVLLVEDNDMVRQLVYDLLDAQGFEVIRAECPKDALQAAEGRQIDLLVTDVVMPGMNGAELHQHLSKMQPGLKVLYMSGYTNNVIVHHGVLEEGINFIQKPFAINDLSKKIGSILGAQTRSGS